MHLAVLSLLSLVGLVLGNGYESFEGLSNEYRLHTERVTWKVANRACQLEGGHLIVIDSEDEAIVSSLIFGRLPPFHPPMPWGYDLMHVGNNDKEKEGEWRTATGGLLTTSGYNVWRYNEPNNHGKAEHCGAIDRIGQFSDLRCHDIHHMCPFVCEKEDASNIDVRDNKSQ